jgi:hypothetical protein
MVDTNMDMVQFAKICRCKTLLSLLLYLVLHYPHARPTSFHLSPLHAEQRSRWEYFEYSIIGDREHLSFRHAMASTTWNLGMGIPDER